MAFSLVSLMGQTWQHRGVRTPVCWLSLLRLEHPIIGNIGQLLLDPVFVSTHIHFQILAYEINAKFSWGRVSGVKIWS